MLRMEFAAEDGASPAAGDRVDVVDQYGHVLCRPPEDGLSFWFKV